MATIRYRGEKNILDIAKNLDAFRKVPEEYTEKSQIGGTLSLLSRILIIVLIYKEMSYYNDANLKFTFTPDIELDSKIKMHVDVTVATPCIALSGIDVADETRENVFSYGTLRRENTWWELSQEQKAYFQEIQQINSFLREEYHSVADIIFKGILSENVEDQITKIPERKDKLSKRHDACRLYGTLTLNKVAGVFQIVEDRHPFLDLLELNLRQIAPRNADFNFTHRINKFSFGDFSSQIIQPLEGDERFVLNDSTVVQYFIEIVPTEVRNLFSTFNTYQYSVKENFRLIDSEKNSYGVPGIYFKYEWSALKIVVQQDRDNMIQFIIRLCSIISGIVVISGIINSVIQAVHRCILKFFAPQYFQIAQASVPISNPEIVDVKPSAILVTNDLLDNANKMNGDCIPIAAVSQ